MVEHDTIRATACCDRMAADLGHRCDQHPDPHDCPDAFITLVRGGYGLMIHDGGSSFVTINFCPWCGSRLPQMAATEPPLDDDVQN